MKKGLFLFLGLLLGLNLLPGRAVAQDKSYDRGLIKVNYWIANYTGTVKIEDTDVYGGTNITLGDELDLDDEFGLDNPQGVPEVEAWIRLGKRHRLIFSYFAADYQGKEKQSLPVEIEGLTFTGNLDTEFKFSRFRLMHQWNPIMNERGRLGLMWGMEYYLWNASFEGVETTLGHKKSVDSSLVVPIPVVGIEGDLNFDYGLGLYGSFSGMGISVSDVQASYTNLDLGLCWNYKMLHTALGYRTIDTRMSGKTDDDNDMDMSFSHNGMVCSVGVNF